MHPIFLVPELLLQITLYLSPSDLANCHLLSHHWYKTLKQNLPPHRRPLPDPAIASKPHISLPQNVLDLASAINTQNTQWLSLPDLSLSDDYHFWLDGAHSNLLSHMKPHLHPFLARNAWSLVDGVAALAEGKMGICLRTECTVKEFFQLFDEHSRNWSGDMLTNPTVSSVEINCPRDACWDPENRSVLTRQGTTWRYQCVRAERAKGVRMCDVLDELRGVLEPEADDGDVLLEWWFGNEAGEENGGRGREQITRSMLEG